MVLDAKKNKFQNNSSFCSFVVIFRTRFPRLIDRDEFNFSFLMIFNEKLRRKFREISCCDDSYIPN